MTFLQITQLCNSFKFSSKSGVFFSRFSWKFSPANKSDSSRDTGMPPAHPDRRRECVRKHNLQSADIPNRKKVIPLWKKTRFQLFLRVYTSKNRVRVPWSVWTMGYTPIVSGHVDLENIRLNQKSLERIFHKFRLKNLFFGRKRVFAMFGVP